jgi:N-acetylglucosaminyl-diphospho-decaprenol L-rhamnosyltransferase
MANPVLEIIIVTAPGNRDFVRACLESLRRYPLTLGAMRVYVVDNASRDGTVEMIRARFPEVELEEMSWNAGFCIANNVVLRRATAPYVLLLNPDTEVLPGTLDHMVELMERRPEVGVAGCRLVRPDGRFDHAAKRSFPTPVSAFGHFTGVGERSRASRRLAQYRAPHLDELASGEVDAVNGAFMLVRRTAVEEVGLLDEGYWSYMEDLDWCYRFKQHGWKVRYEGSVTAIHVKGGASVRQGHRALRPNFAFHRGMARFYRKFYGGERPLVDVAVYAGIGLKFGVSATRAALARLGNLFRRDGASPTGLPASNGKRAASSATPQSIQKGDLEEAVLRERPAGEPGRRTPAPHTR